MKRFSGNISGCLLYSGSQFIVPVTFKKVLLANCESKQKEILS